MHQQYNTPPLFEVACEMIFAQGESWDVFYFKDFYDKVKEHFPHKAITEEFVFTSTGVDNPSPVSEKRSTLECKNEERNLMLTFKENFLGITVVPPYMGWSNFKSNISYVLDAYKEVVDPVLMHRAVLKYRNKVNAGTSHSYDNLSNSFTMMPNLDNLSLDKESLRAMQMVLEFYSSDKKSILSIQQHTLQPTKDYPAPVLLDLGYLCIDATGFMKEEGFEEWLNEANEAIHQVFQTSLTQDIKETFN